MVKVFWATEGSFPWFHLTAILIFGEILFKRKYIPVTYENLNGFYRRKLKIGNFTLSSSKGGEVKINFRLEPTFKKSALAARTFKTLMIDSLENPSL